MISGARALLLLAAVALTAVLGSPRRAALLPILAYLKRFSAHGEEEGNSSSAKGGPNVLMHAYYTGGGSQLGLAILCKSESSNIHIRSKLSQSGGRITGTWEERTFNAEGNASGRPTVTRSVFRSAAA